MQGMLLVAPAAIAPNEVTASAFLTRLWVHEAARTCSDRCSSHGERAHIMKKVTSARCRVLTLPPLPSLASRCLQSYTQQFYSILNILSIFSMIKLMPCPMVDWCMRTPGRMQL